MKRPLAVAGALLCLCAWNVDAKEGGDQYQNGVESWFAGALPPPGNYFISYTGYWQGALRDGKGNKVDFGDGQHAKLNATFEALRLVHVSDATFLGANYGWHVIVPVVNLSIDHPALGGRASQFGLGDVTVGPVVLGWHRGNWNYIAALDINLKTGHYDQHDPRTSIGANYSSFEPVFAVSYMNPSGWDASAKFMYNIKTKNTATGYQSGDEFHLDWLVGKNVGSWGVGLSGFYLKQVTDDRQDGQIVPLVPGVWGRGRRGQVLGMGPSIKYTTKGHVSIIAQWQKELEVENRFADNKLLVKAVIPL